MEIPGAWVRRVLINLLIDGRRRERRNRSLLERLGPPGSVDPPAPRDVAWWDAVTSLPDQQRMVITLYYVDDRSVAEVLNIAAGTVKATLSQARDRLRRLLSEEAST
jgi:RNA polymerase sigma-70 factor (ECF subfamily)